MSNIENLSIDPALALFMAIKNQDREVVDCTDLYVEYAGYSSKQDVIGKKDEDFSWQDRASGYQVQERDALDGKIYSVIELATICTGETILLLTNKSPVYADGSEIVSGIKVFSMQVHNKVFLDFLASDPLASLNTNSGYHFLKPENAVHLTNKEEVILFHLLRGKTAKMLAKLLDNSPRTIEAHIANMKMKFDCATKADLVSKAFELGYSGYIPESIVVNQQLNIEG